MNVLWLEHTYLLNVKPSSRVMFLHKRAFYEFRLAPVVRFPLITHLERYYNSSKDMSSELVMSLQFCFIYSFKV